MKPRGPKQQPEKFHNPVTLQGLVCGGELGKSPGKSQFCARALGGGQRGQMVSPQRRGQHEGTAQVPSYPGTRDLQHLLLGEVSEPPPSLGALRAFILQGMAMPTPTPIPNPAPGLVGCSMGMQRGGFAEQSQVFKARSPFLAGQGAMRMSCIFLVAPK